MFEFAAKAAAVLGLLWLNSPGWAQDAKKPEPKKIPEQAARLLGLPPEEFLRLFDKNRNDHMDRAETPKFLLRAFDVVDRNKDEKLDRKEIVEMQQVARRFLGKTPPPPTADQVVASFLKRYDKDDDGKISKKEAEERLAKAFPFFDRNKDEFLDRNELMVLAEKVAAGARGAKGPGGGAFAQPKVDPWDFDAQDLDADGRLTRKELQGTRHASRFDAIDTDRSGRIDPREFEAYRLRELEKKD